MLQECQIPCKVIETHSIIRKKNTFEYETGCDIILTNYNYSRIPETVWNPLLSKYSIQCAHLSIDNIFSGCIYDFIRQSNCPG